MKKAPSLAIVDDDNLIVSLLSSFFRNKGLTVAIEAEDGQDLISQLEKLPSLPDIVLMDLRMKGVDGLSALEILKQDFGTLKTIILSSFYNDSSIGFMLKAGVNAFLPKGILPEKLFDIIHEVYEKDFYFTATQIGIIKGQLPHNPQHKPQIDDQAQLSAREQEILSLLCQQYTAKEIGEKLFIAQRTVEGHKKNILQKTGMKNTAGLVVYAIQQKIFDPSQG